LKLSVIFTTYNSPEWLRKVLWGFSAQTDLDFEVVVADDGSGQETEAVIQVALAEGLSIQHIWQPDDGFNKCQILNKAIIAATGDYLIFTDGDCVPRRDFVAQHRLAMAPGHFLSGGYFKLSMPVSQALTREDVIEQRCFQSDWLTQGGMKKSLKSLKLSASEFWQPWLNRLTPTKPTWNGHNASCFKADALAVNGFDQRLRYGGLDREFGERLVNAGLSPKQIRYSAVTVHLDHPRSYESAEGWAFNHAIRSQVRKEKITVTPAGIQQLAH
jgi:glycosyltransferase involved in cell wall biosynthesis